MATKSTKTKEEAAEVVEALEVVEETPAEVPEPEVLPQDKPRGWRQ